MGLLDGIGAIPEAPRRQIVLEEAYYDFFNLKTNEESQHPLTGVLALQSESTFERSSTKQRIDEYIDLEIGVMGIDIHSFLSLPREYVLYIVKKATAIKERKAKALANMGNQPPS